MCALVVVSCRVRNSSMRANENGGNWWVVKWDRVWLCTVIERYNIWTLHHWWSSLSANAFSCNSSVDGLVSSRGKWKCWFFLVGRLSPCILHEDPLRTSTLSQRYCSKHLFKKSFWAQLIQRRCANPAFVAETLQGRSWSMVRHLLSPNSAFCAGCASNGNGMASLGETQAIVDNDDDYIVPTVTESVGVYQISISAVGLSFVLEQDPQIHILYSSRESGGRWKCPIWTNWEKVMLLGFLLN